jgi:hypothetical protein
MNHFEEYMGGAKGDQAILLPRLMKANDNEGREKLKSSKTTPKYKTQITANHAKYMNGDPVSRISRGSRLIFFLRRGFGALLNLCGICDTKSVDSPLVGIQNSCFVATGQKYWLVMRKKYINTSQCRSVPKLASPFLTRS